MPDSVLLILIFSVSIYATVIGIAAIRSVLARRERTGVSSELPPVSVVVPDQPDLLEAVIEAISKGAYPKDRVEIISMSAQPNATASHFSSPDASIRHVPVDEPLTSPETVRSAFDAASGDVVLLPGTEGTVKPGWIHAMVSRCTPNTPVVAGPTIVEHDDLFLPRLEALQHLGITALTEGLSSTPPPRVRTSWNAALRSHALVEAPEERESPATPESHPVDSLVSRDASFISDAAAAIRCAPASTFDEYFRRLVTTIRSALWTGSAQRKLLGLVLWVPHLVVLVCCVVAVVLPTWRQPALLGLLGKMGADGFLLTPSARHYGERKLLRSFVPSELLLVLVVPFAGLFALPAVWGSSDRDSASFSQ